MQKVKDRILILGVGSLVAIDLIILVTYYIVEGLQRDLVVTQVPNQENPTVVEGVSKFCSIHNCGRHM